MWLLQPDSQLSSDNLDIVFERVLLDRDMGEHMELSFQNVRAEPPNSEL